MSPVQKGPHLDPADFLAEMWEFGRLRNNDAIEQYLHGFEHCPECIERLLTHCDIPSLEALRQEPCMATALVRGAEASRGDRAAARLVALLPEERFAAAMADPELRSDLALYALLRRCRAVWSTEPERALELAKLVTQLLPEAPEQLSDLAELEDLYALAWAYQGNVLRIQSRLPEAKSALDLASRQLSPGVCNLEVQAEVLALRASLHRAQRNYNAAQLDINRAVQLYGEVGSPRLQGQELLTSAKIRCESGDPTGGLADLERAAPLLDTDREPRFCYVPMGLRMHILCELGRYADARAELAEAWRLAARHGSDSDQLRLRWCEGRIYAALGPAEKAESAFREARGGFLAAHNGFDTALVTLDLAVLLAGEGRLSEVRELAAEMVTLFQSQQVAGEALAAALLFVQASEQEAVSAEVLRTLRQRLEGVARR